MYSDGLGRTGALPAGTAEDWGSGGHLPVNQVSTYTTCRARSNCGM